MAFHIGNDDSLNLYRDWESPATIISDGAYGIGGFVGDPKTPDALVDWYEPHVSAWSELSTSLTSLWFWCTEVGWATVHPLLVSYGWKYVELVTWNKGMGQVAGNVNSKTIRRFPVATEVAGLYVRPQAIKTSEGQSLVQDWLRAEWRRSGLPFSEANKACGVGNAASRKWLTADSEWYAPSWEMFNHLKEYANRYGKVAAVPYFSSADAVSLESWEKLRSRWNHSHGYTNVWDVPSLRGSERVKGVDGKFIHTNQKPLELMRRQVSATTNSGDAVWEPFGGLCSASVAAHQMDRVAYAGEKDKAFFDAAKLRLNQAKL